jgi:phage terminase small subunit
MTSNGRAGPADGLTGKQRAFVAEYLVDLNGRQAAIRAGYAADSAAVEASRLLRNAKVADAIDAAMATRAGVTRTFIIDELAKIARANAGDFFEWGPKGVTVKASADLDEEQRGVVAEVSQTVTQHGGSIRVKLSDRQAALEKLGRALGMFGDRIVVSELMEEVAELRRMLDARRAGDDGELTPSEMQELEELRRIVRERETLQ